jgi:hypothetical protein
MNDDPREMENAVILVMEDYREVVARMMTLIERLTARVEVLERAALPMRDSPSAT